MGKQLKRDYSIDILRIVAAFLVIVNHSNSEIFLNSGATSLGKISLLYFFVSKVAVGIFFMISGALMLKKEESYKTVYIDRFGKFLLILILASFYEYWRLHGLVDFSVFAFIKLMFTKPVFSPLWYLYSYLTLLLALPFLRKMSLNMSKKDHLIFIIITILMTSFSTFFTILTGIKMSAYSVLFFHMIVGFFFLGNYIFNLMDKSKFTVKGVWINIVLLVLSLSFSLQFTLKELQKYGEYKLQLDNYANFLTVVSAVAIVYITKFIFNRIELSKTVGTFITKVSSSTFFIYLSHSTALIALYGVYDFLKSKVNTLIAMFIYEVIVFVVCSLIYLVGKAVFNYIVKIMRRQNSPKSIN